jgi:hypothetical protein
LRRRSGASKSRNEPQLHVPLGKVEPGTWGLVRRGSSNCQHRGALLRGQVPQTRFSDPEPQVPAQPRGQGETSALQQRRSPETVRRRCLSLGCCVCNDSGLCFSCCLNWLITRHYPVPFFPLGRDDLQLEALETQIDDLDPKLERIANRAGRDLQRLQLVRRCRDLRWRPLSGERQDP